MAASTMRAAGATPRYTGSSLAMISAISVSWSSCGLASGVGDLRRCLAVEVVLGQEVVTQVIQRHDAEGDGVEDADFDIRPECVPLGPQMIGPGRTLGVIEREGRAALGEKEEDSAPSNDPDPRMKATRARGIEGHEVDRMPRQKKGA